MENSDFPALYRAADEKSINAQKDFLWWTKGRLGLLLVAAISGVVQWRIGKSPTDWAAVVGATAFACAALVEVRLLNARPDRVWYEGRAVAESVKTLTWRYISGGRPFPITDPSASAATDDLFLERLSQIVAEVQRSGLSAPASSSQQISDVMRECRSDNLEARRRRYRDGRIENQREWYADKAKLNDSLATRWSVFLLLAEAIGVLAAVLKATGVLGVDVLGVVSALTAAVVAWVQTKQHVTLSRAYAVASHELAAIASRIRWINTEAAWSEFVDQSEEAISREHTMWRASHT